MAESVALSSLREGDRVVVGGDRQVIVDAALAAAFAPGDRLIVAGTDVLHIPAADADMAAVAVGAAVGAVTPLARCSGASITAFFEDFARRLEDPSIVALLRAANERDAADAAARGRSTTRLVLDDAMLAAMVEGLRMWRDTPDLRDVEVARVDHDGWHVAARQAPLGAVGFVFEGRPNVFADAAGVVRSGNTAVLRIGSDALGTATAIVEHAVAPALSAAGLPTDAMVLVGSRAHAAGWAMFADDRLALAVARGSGAAVAQLGAVARAVGTPVSLHGTGGAWVIAADDADEERLAATIENSLDRKVCNTVNTVCVPTSRADDLVGVVMDAVAAAGRRRGVGARVHVTAAAAAHLDTSPDGLDIVTIADEELGHEWEWENVPECTVAVVADVDDAVERFNRWSPHFVCSVITTSDEVVEQVYATVDAPFVGDGFTRWVDGQYALGEPELGLSNWEGGRLLGRGGVLSGASVHTVRLLARFNDVSIRR